MKNILFWVIAVIVALVIQSIIHPSVPSKEHYSTMTLYEYEDVASYMSALKSQVKFNWRPPISKKAVSLVVMFKVHKDGQLSDIKINKSSGRPETDQAGLEAVERTSQFGYPPQNLEDSFDVQMTLGTSVH
jgi:TonB family protein